MQQMVVTLNGSGNSNIRVQHIRTTANETSNTEWKKYRTTKNKSEWNE